MAALWSRLQQEVCATVDDFRVKGAVAVLKDAALDTRDMAKSLGGDLWDGVKGLVAEPTLHVQSLPVRGSVATLEFPDGRVVQATVVEVDTVSEPPRAKVAAPGVSDLLIVDISVGTVPGPLPSPQQQQPDPFLTEEKANADGQTELSTDTAVDSSSATAASPPSAEMSLLDLLKEDCRATVDEFREKGAVGAVRDAALDAANMVGSTASKAVSGAKSLAAPLVADTQPARSGAEQEDADPTTREASSATSGESVNLLDLPLFDNLKQELREKGAMGAVKDAALDAKDILGTTARSAVIGAKSFATELLDGNRDDGAVNEEAASAEGNEESESRRDADAGGASLLDLPLFDGLKQGYHSTVQDFREKGAVGAVKDAALDAADVVRGSASTAFDGAKRIGNELLAAASDSSAVAQLNGEGMARNDDPPTGAKEPGGPQGGILTKTEDGEDLID